MTFRNSYFHQVRYFGWKRLIEFFQIPKFVHSNVRFRVSRRLKIIPLYLWRLLHFILYWGLVVHRNNIHSSTVHLVYFNVTSIKCRSINKAIETLFVHCSLQLCTIQSIITLKFQLNRTCVYKYVSIITYVVTVCALIPIDQKIEDWCQKCNIAMFDKSFPWNVISAWLVHAIPMRPMRKRREAKIDFFSHFSLFRFR